MYASVILRTFLVFVGDWDVLAVRFEEVSLNLSQLLVRDLEGHTEVVLHISLIGFQLSQAMGQLL